MALPILLVIAALAFLVLEVFLVSFGTLSLVAIACGVGGTMLAFGQGTVQGWSMVAVLLVGGPACLWGAFRVLPKLPFARGFYLEPPRLSEQDRRAAAGDAGHPPIGALGVARSPLRPSGTALFGDEAVSVVTRGSMLAPGTRVRVVDVSGNRIVVEPE